MIRVFVHESKIISYSTAVPPIVRRTRTERPAVPKEPLPQLDDVDNALLEALAEDARITNQALAERVGVAPSTALTRLRGLRTRGVIKGFHTEVDLAALGRPLQALIAVRLAV